MANTTPYEVVESLQELLDSKISDPNNDRNDDARWIYTIPINFDLAKYPRIHIHELNTTHEGLSIGSTDRWSETRIQVSVFMDTSTGNEMDVDNDGDLERPIEIVDHLVEQVISNINGNQARWRGLGTNVHSFITDSSNRVQNKDNVLHHTVDAVLRHNTG